MKTQGLMVSLFAAVVAISGCRDENAALSNAVDLSGTWDVTYTDNGAAGEARTVVIDENGLSFRKGAKNHFSMVSSATGYDVSIGGRVNINGMIVEDETEESDYNSLETGTVTPSTISTGASFLMGLPFDLGGKWEVRDPESDGCGEDCDDGAPPEFVGCNLNFAEGALRAECMGGVSPDDAVFSRVEDGVYIGTRTGNAESIFGDLSGTWELRFPSGDGLIFTFVDHTITYRPADVDADEIVAKTRTIVVNGNMITGTAPDGIEFAAIRR